jgi:Ser/Thr protein kinase RdoA (MazF antagonist)
MERTPYPYATSFPLEELTLYFSDGSSATTIFKDLAWERLLADASRTKPRFLYEPRRSIETYRRILAPEGLGARCHVAIAEPDVPRYWLLLEKVPGVQLWQVGDFATWEGVARWLARFHARFANRVAAVRQANPHLLEYNAQLLGVWLQRACAALQTSPDTRARALLDILDGYDQVIDAIASLPVTLVHGEFYPLNILVGVEGSGAHVWPVDWEMAATGPGLLDLAALAGGWSASHRQRLVAAYHTEIARLGADVPTLDATHLGVDLCRLHLALQWLGWSPGWVAKHGRDHDWLGEALDLARALIGGNSVEIFPHSPA